MRIVELDVPTHERVVACRDPESGLHAIIALHDTTRGQDVATAAVDIKCKLPLLQKHYSCHVPRC